MSVQKSREKSNCHNSLSQGFVMSETRKSHPGEAGPPLRPLQGWKSWLDRTRLDRPGFRRSQCFENVHSRGVATHGCADLRSLNLTLNRLQHFPRDMDAFFARGLRSWCCRHPMENLIGHRDAQLVLHEFSIADAHQRPDSSHHRNAAVFDPAEKCFQQPEIENRLCHNIFRASVNLVLEPSNLLIQV